MAAVAAAAVTATAMAPTIVIVTMIMMVAAHIRIEIQHTGQKCLNGIISIPVDATEETDTCVGKGHLRAGTNAAADHGIHTQGAEKCSQSAMAVTGSFHHLGSDDIIVFHFVDLKGSGVAEVLEDQPRFIGNSNFHSDLSFTRYSIAANEANVKYRKLKMRGGGRY